VLDLFSNLYSELDIFFFVETSGLSSCLTFHCLLTIYPIDYCPKERVNDFGLRRQLYSKQDLKDACCSSI